MSNVQSDKEVFASVIPVRGTDFEPRPRQLFIVADFIRMCVAGAVAAGHTEAVVLPTGYGKTILGILLFVVARFFKLANRLLIVVPASSLTDQYMSDLEFICRSLRLNLSFMRYVNNVAAAENGVKADVLVTTYHMLQKETSEHLLDDAIMRAAGAGAWMGIFEEAHHLGMREHNTETPCWYKRVKRLPLALLFLFTATPFRTDMERIYGLRYGAEGEPVLRPGWSVTFLEAAQEGVVRWLHTHSFHYDIEVAYFNDRNQMFNTVVRTDLLREEGVLNREGEPGAVAFERFEVRRRVRYRMDYVEPLYRQVRECLEDRRRRTKVYHQGIGFCMSVLHAKACAEAWNRFFPGEADYIGESAVSQLASKSDEENKKTLDRYRRGELLILFNVAKIGEGFNHPPASVGLWMSLTRSEHKTVQEIGRISRRRPDIEKAYDDVGHVFCSSDHIAAEVAETMCPTAAARGEVEKGPGPDKGPPGWPPLPRIPDITIIRAENTGVDHASLNGAQPQHSWDAKEARAWVESILGVERAAAFSDDELIRLYCAHPEAKDKAACPDDGAGNGRPCNLDTASDQAHDQVKASLSTLASTVARRLIVAGYHPNVQGREFAVLVGAVKKAINGRYKRRFGAVNKDQSGIDKYVHKNRWLQELREQLDEAGREMPSWLLESVLQ
jgi:superfamily II DNA or RNA helicase